MFSKTLLAILIPEKKLCLRRILIMVDLTRSQKKTVDLLAKSPLRDKFYWTGGTLLAYHYLGHRRSLDLDFFSQERFSFEEVNFPQDFFFKRSDEKLVPSNQD